VMYCVGLPAFAAVAVMTRTFYALGDTGTPVRASFVAVAINLSLNLLFVGPLRSSGLGHLGLALATSVTSIVNLLQLGAYLRRSIGPLEGRRMLDALGRIAIASGVAVLPGWIALRILGDVWRGRWLTEMVVVLAGLLVALAAGYLAMRRMRVPELATIESLVRSVLRRLVRR